eukprot:7906245-Pyramimonas_sp.AAC.1
MLCFLFLRFTFSPSSSRSSLSTCDFHAVALCLDARLSPPRPPCPPGGAELSRKGSGGLPLTTIAWR